MKKTLIFACLLTFVSLLGAGCSDDSGTNNGGGNNSNAANSFTLNGGGFSNKVYDFPTNAVAFGGRDTSTGLTGGSVSGTIGGETVTLLIALPSRTGTFPFAADSTSGLSISIGNQGFVGLPSDTIKGIPIPASGSITVTSYGNVGGNITGTFSGSIFKFTPTVDTTAVQVNGRFSFIRAL